MTRSPISRRFGRYKMQHAAAYAIGAALHRAPPFPSASDNNRIQTLARRITQCAVSTTLKIATPPGDATHIVYRNKRRCRSGLCPPCARKRAWETVKRIAAVLDAVIVASPDMRFALLTLTSRNMPIEAVSDMLRLQESAMARFFRAKAVRNALQGHVTGIEIAIRSEDGNWQAGVHSHSLAALCDGYFDRTKPIYLSQRAIVDLWRAALRVDYKPICHIRAIPNSDAAHASLTECLKYAVAPHRLFERDNGGFSVDPLVAAHLANALYKRRMCRTAGVFSKPRRPNAEGTAV
jgi:hypothetical protein